VGTIEKADGRLRGRLNGRLNVAKQNCYSTGSGLVAVFDLRTSAHFDKKIWESLVMSLSGDLFFILVMFKRRITKNL